MAARMSLRHVRAVLSEELAAIRKHEPDLDAGHITVFSIPLLLGLVGVLAIGVVPLIVVRSGDETDAVLVPLVGSFALAAICTAVVAWLTANVLSGVVVMVLYRTSPRTASQLVVRTMVDSFYRIEDITGRIALLAVVAGLLSVAFGLPNRQGEDRANSVLDDLLTAQLACLVVALSIAFVAESIRCAADIVDDQSLLLAWPWALLIASLGWSSATVLGPFETTRMLEILLNDWLHHGSWDAAAAADRRTAALVGAVVGRPGPAAPDLWTLGLHGVASARARPHAQVSRRWPEY